MGEALEYAFSRDDRRPDLPYFTWSIVGPAGGVHIHAQQHGEDHVERWGDRYTGGVECHWPCSAEDAAHADCWLLKGPCRHDGTSLYFSERIAPMLHPDSIESDRIREWVNSILLDWYRSNIEAEVA